MPVRRCLLLLAFIAAVLPGSAQQPAEPHLIPITGKAGPGLEPFDQAVARMMDRHGIPGASLAVAKNGKLVFARGYGVASVTPNRLTLPTTQFGLASLSKTITALAVLKLVEDGKLGLDDRAFEYLKDILPPRGSRSDPRLGLITVRQLLDHSGGWNRNLRGDPINQSPLIARRLGARQPLTAEQFISYIKGQPLDFDPGTDGQYSNIGYVALGLIIARVSGQSYEQYVRAKVLAPAGLSGAGLHRLDNRYLPGEATRYLAGTINALPPLQEPMVDAAGGWSASTVDMVRLLTALDGSRGKPLLAQPTFELMLARSPTVKPRPDATHFGLGWDIVAKKDGKFGYFKDGSFHGMRTFMKRNLNGVSAVLLFNASMMPDSDDTRYNSEVVRGVREAVERMEKYPDIDLFDEFR